MPCIFLHLQLVRPLGFLLNSLDFWCTLRLMVAETGTLRLKVQPTLADKVGVWWFISFDQLILLTSTAWGLALSRKRMMRAGLGLWRRFIPSPWHDKTPRKWWSRCHWVPRKRKHENKLYTQSTNWAHSKRKEKREQKYTTVGVHLWIQFGPASSNYWTEILHVRMGQIRPDSGEECHLPSLYTYVRQYLSGELSPKVLFFFLQFSYILYITSHSLVQIKCKDAGEMRHMQMLAC